jgi:hypothetical protein
VNLCARRESRMLAGAPAGPHARKRVESCVFLRFSSDLPPTQGAGARPQRLSGQALRSPCQAVPLLLPAFPSLFLPTLSVLPGPMLAALAAIAGQRKGASDLIQKPSGIGPIECPLLSVTGHLYSRILSPYRQSKSAANPPTCRSGSR